ncbi:hypothetical protein EROP_29330 [Erysipelotrichaceae bacterium OPF54]|nr:hypothetical protein EROP_29330 [Erysipelotrichaceae bacterium OPF54]
MALYFEVEGSMYISVVPQDEAGEEIVVDHVEPEVIETFKKRIAKMFCASKEDVQEISKEYYLKHVDEESNE